jgi:DMSO/TMAO reductase YedYZ molybdopterin-dependent catalytic subunit
MPSNYSNAADSDSRSQAARRRLLNRRRFMMASETLAGVAIAGGVTGAADGDGEGAGRPPPLRPGGDQAAFEERYPGLRVMTARPENAEAASRSTYTKGLTPPEEHYVRNQYPMPEIDAAEWSIELRGLGLDESAELDVQTLREAYSTESVAHTMQCSGNGRAAFEPEVDGVQWTTGAVGTTVWTGAPLREVLAEAGQKPGTKRGS